MNRYPYHRYLTYQVLNGESPQEIIEHMEGLEYVPPDREDIEELQAQLLRQRVTFERREKFGILFFDEDSPSVELMFSIVETPPMRTCIERLLLDRVHPKHVATIVSLKFNEKLTVKCIEFFREGFWDTSVCTPIDFSHYFRLAGDRKPDPPPEAVSLLTRPHYARWKEGDHPDEDELSPEAMVREIGVDSFMMFKELSSGANKDVGKAKSMAELNLKTAGARKALSEGRRGKTDKIPDLAPKLSYPTAQVATLGELHSEYSEVTSGTGSESKTMGKREGEGEDAA